MRAALRLRLRVLAGFLILIVFVLVARLYFVQIVNGDEYSLRAERQYVSASHTLYDRGSIYYTRKDGTALSGAALATGFLVAIDPSKLKNAPEVYDALVALFPLERETYDAAVAKTNDPYEVLARRVPEDAGRAISALDVPGVIVERERWRIYPAEERGAQTIGFVAYDNDNDLAGRFGLERYYEDVLTRKNTGLFGNFFAELFANLDSAVGDASEAREGDLITSIEPVVLDKLDQVLMEIQGKYSSAESGGIIMDPKTGEIIALETVPSFDPNTFAEQDSEHFGNPMVEKRYEFGSIVKAITMTAGLDAGVVTPDTTYNDTGKITLNNKTISNYDGKARGVVPMQEVLSQSLNIGASYIAGRLGHERMRQYFTELGMGAETGIDLPSEISGTIDNILESPRDVEYATASFGQGIAQTPVEMVKALGALANDGKVVTPHVVRAIKLESGIVKELSWGNAEQVFKPKAVEQVTHMLVNVVDKSLAGGTVSIPEMSVAAKTGTAQIAGPGGKYYDDRYFHSFFGYFPAYDPKFIILLYTREPKGVEYASETLTHPFMELTQFLIGYYAIPPDRVEYAPSEE
ncbi:MAG: penicillin-binding protein 2 [Candidatus Pacebacteria bacterium]|nr:penicillin-binding protein 2 [Candidatus Paceibacterota bacterium]